MSFFYDLNKKLDSIRATPEVTHKQLNERDMSRAAKGYEKYGKEGMEALAKAGREGKALDPVRKKYDKYDNNKEVNEMWGDPYHDDAKVDAINAANPPKASGTGMKPAIPVKHHTYDRKDVASNISGKDSAAYDYRGQVEEGPMDTVKKIGKRVASGINKLVGHGSDEEMRKDLQRKSGAPVTGKKPEQKTTEAAKYRDPKYKDKLYTQEPPDYTYGPDMDDAYDNPKPDDYAGRKRKIGGGEFPSTDPLERGQGIGRSGIKNNILDRGPRKGLPSRDQISSLKGSIKSARGTHAEPNLPEAAGSIDYEKVLEAIAALYGDDMWDNDAMGDLAQDLEQAGPTDRELDFIIAKGKLPTRLKGIRFTNTDDVQFGHLDEKSGDQMTATGKKLNFADKIASAKKEVDEMLGDVAAEAMRSALSPKQKKIAGMAGDPNKIGADDLAALRKGRKPEMDEERSKGTAFDMSTPRAATPKVGSVERGHKHDIKHTATGRMVTRRVDDQGNSVGADDDSEASGEKRGRGRPKGTKQSIGAKGPSGKSKLMTKEGDVDVTDQGEYDQEGDMAKDDIKTIVRHAQALEKILGDDDNLPEWVQSKLAKIEGMMISIDEYMQNQESDDEEPIAEKAVSKQQQTFMGMAHAMQKGEKIKGASPELKKVAKTMKPKDTEDFAKTKHKGLPEKAPKKKKEEEVDESTTSGSVATSTATTGSKGGVFGKGIYDSMNRELENMIAESMSINMSDSTEGNKSLTVTATDEDAMKLAMMLKSAGLGGHDHDMHSGMAEAVDENSPDYPTNTQQAENNFGYSGGLNKPKTDVAGDGQTTVPNTAVHTQDEDALRRMMEMAGLAEAAKPDFLDLDDDNNKNEPMKDAAADADDEEEDTVKENIQRMREMAGIKEAKKQVDQNSDGKNDFEDIKIARMKASGAIDDKEEKKVDESIFALTNQWKTYKG